MKCPVRPIAPQPPKSEKQLPLMFNIGTYCKYEITFPNLMNVISAELENKYRIKLDLNNLSFLTDSQSARVHFMYKFPLSPLEEEDFKLKLIVYEEELARFNEQFKKYTEYLQEKQKKQKEKYKNKKIQKLKLELSKLEGNVI